MKIKVDSDVLGNTIKLLQKIVQVQQLSISLDANFMNIIGVGNGNSALMTSPIQVVEKSKHRKFSVGAAALLDAMSKRKDVTIEVKEGSLIVRAKQYEIELMISPFEEVEVVPADVKNDKSGIKLKDKFLNELREILPKLELKPLMASYDYIPFGIKSTKNGTFVACFDHYQSAFYNNPDLPGNVDFTLPSNVFTLLTRELKGQNYVMSITDSAVYAFNDNFELALARPQAEGQQLSLDNMLVLYETLKSQGKKGATVVKFKKESIVSLTENARAIYERDSTFTFTTKGNKGLMELKSSYGKITNTIMLEEEPAKPVSFSCDFNFFSTLLAKAPPTISLTVTDKLMLFNNKPVTYLLSLI